MMCLQPSRPRVRLTAWISLVLIEPVRVCLHLSSSLASIDLLLLAAFVHLPSFIHRRYGPCVRPGDSGNGRRNGGDGVCRVNATRRCRVDSDCSVQGPCDRTAKPCCSCWPFDKDARWPGVFGSPIVTSMGRMEYVVSHSCV
jgi:hypothetical protein